MSSAACDGYSSKRIETLIAFLIPNMKYLMDKMFIISTRSERSENFNVYRFQTQENQQSL